MAVREWNDQIVFLRKIVEGGTDKSYGIQVARLAGVPKAIIDRSKEILSNLEGAELWGTNLTNAMLRGANLEGAILEGAIFSEETILPDFTKWTSDTNMNRFTDPSVRA